MAYDTTNDEMYCAACEEATEVLIPVEPETWCCLSCAQVWQEDIYPLVCTAIVE